MASSGTPLAKQAVSTARLGPTACACRCLPLPNADHEVVISSSEAGVDSGGWPRVLHTGQVDQVSAVAGLPPVGEEAPLPPAVARVLEAQKLGRALEARREARALESEYPELGVLLGANVLERVSRVAARFDTSLEEVMPSLLPSDGWVTEEATEGAQFAYRLSDGLFHLMSTARYEGCSALNALAALCEYDLCPAYNLDVRDVTCIGEHVSTDSAWHVSKQTKGGLEDQILHVSCIDALEERGFSALWASVYSPNKPPEPPSSMTRPATLHGRQAVLRNTFRIVPRRTTRGEPAFDMHLSLLSRPNDSAHRMLKSYSVSAMKNLIRDELGKFPANFRRHIMGEALGQRILTSPRAPFYDAIRRHLSVWQNPIGNIVDVRPSPVKSEVISPPPTCVESARVPKVGAADDSDSTAEPVVPAFEEFSAQLPDCWAD